MVFSSARKNRGLRKLDYTLRKCEACSAFGAWTNKKMPMKMLVTELRSRGHEVWVSDLMNAGGINYIRCDVSRYRQVRSTFEEHRFDYVYHAAAEFGQEKVTNGYLG